MLEEGEARPEVRAEIVEYWYISFGEDIISVDRQGLTDSMVFWWWCNSCVVRGVAVS